MGIIKTAYKDFLKYREYILYSVRSELKVQLSSTFLGYLWWILDPLMYMLVYMLVVMVIFRRGGPGFPVFVFAALVPWKWTVSSIMDAIGSIKSKSGLLHQVYIPKYVLTLIKLLINTCKFLFGILVLLILLPFFKIPYSFYNIGFFAVFIVNTLFIFSLSLIFAHLGVYFKDINNIMQFVTRLWFYLSPALYTVDSVPAKIRFLWWFNPMTTFYQSYRNVFLYNTYPLYKELLVWFIISFILTVIGLKKVYSFDKNYTKVI